MSIYNGDLILIVAVLLLSLNLFVALAAAGSPVLALISETGAWFTRRVFLEKFALQTGRMGLLALVYTMLVAGGSLAIGMAQAPGSRFLPDAAHPLLLPGAAAAGCWLVLLLLLSYALKPGKNIRWLRLVLTLGAAVSSLGTVFMATLVGASLFGPAEFSARAVPAPGSAFWAHAAQWMVLGLVCAGALSLVWLVARRNRDDFGRDYYAFVPRFGAWCCMAALIAAAGVHVWLAAVHAPQVPPAMAGVVMAAWYAVLGCGIAALGCWSAVAWARLPMSRKSFMFLGLGLAFLALAGLVFVGLKLFLAISY
jgi:hypothetical protein